MRLARAPPSPSAVAVVAAAAVGAQMAVAVAVGSVHLLALAFAAVEVVEFAAAGGSSGWPAASFAGHVAVVGFRLRAETDTHTRTRMFVEPRGVVGCKIVRSGRSYAFGGLILA